VEVNLPREIAEGLAVKAREANISPEDAAVLILSEFVTGQGSRIFAGTWRRGDAGGKRGMRYVIQWPFQPGLVKIPGDKSIDLGKG